MNRFASAGWSRLVAAAGLSAAAYLLAASAASAQTVVTLPDTSQTSTVAANVAEQARVSVPVGISFNVTNVGAESVAGAATVTVDQIVLATATRSLRLSLRAAASAFTPPAPGDVTWAASSVTWNAADWTAATGSSGTLSDTAYAPVATCDPGVAACSTTGLVFRLAPNTAVQRSGTHTLTVVWKVESIGS